MLATTLKTIPLDNGPDTRVIKQPTRNLIRVSALRHVGFGFESYSLEQERPACFAVGVCSLYSTAVSHKNGADKSYMLQESRVARRFFWQTTHIMIREQYATVSWLCVYGRECCIRLSSVILALILTMALSRSIYHSCDKNQCASKCPSLARRSGSALVSFCAIVIQVAENGSRRIYDYSVYFSGHTSHRQLCRETVTAASYRCLL